MSTERDEGQMMLLAAVVLIVAFLALTVLVARIGIVESEIGRDAANTLLIEGDALPPALCFAIKSTTTQAHLNGTLEYVGTQLVARGILAKFTTFNSGNVTASLTDGRSRLTVNVDEARGDCP